MENQKTALDTQIGGSHYKLAIQPVEFAMTEGYHFCAASMLKYITRHASKNGRQDVEKALHFYQLSSQVMSKHRIHQLYDVSSQMFSSFGLRWVRHEGTIRTLRNEAPAGNMTLYITANGFSGKTAEALECLDCWARGIGGEYSRRLPFVLQELLDEYEAQPLCQRWEHAPGRDNLPRVCDECGVCEGTAKGGRPSEAMPE